MVLTTKTSLAKALATGLYSGYSPRAPGTAGSAAYAAITILLVSLSPSTFNYAFQIITALAVTATALVSTDICLKSSIFKDPSDPQEVVIDEWAGLAVALIGSTPNIANILLSLVLFRIFDIWKPWPIKHVEKLPGSWGVTCDDLVAGFFALITFQIITQLF